MNDGSWSSSQSCISDYFTSTAAHTLVYSSEANSDSKPLDRVKLKDCEYFSITAARVCVVNAAISHHTDLLRSAPCRSRRTFRPFLFLFIGE